MIWSEKCATPALSSLEKLQAIDSVATAQAEWRNSIDEIRTQITVLRIDWIMWMSCRWHLGKGKK